MLEQASLPGIEAAAPPTDRLFFAILPDPAAAASIASLAQRLRGEHGLKGKPLPAERLHVTLHFLGDHPGLPRDLVARAGEAAATVDMPPFEIRFDRAGSFSRPRHLPFVLRGSDGVAGLAAFHQMLGATLRKAGLPLGPPASFTPHVTLLYDDRRVAEQPVEPIVWTAREFVLVDSLIGQGVHRPLARWSRRV